MNSFEFIGTIPNRDGLVKTNENGKQLRFCIKQNEKNHAYVQLFGEKQFCSKFNVFLRDGKRIDVSYDNRWNGDILRNVSYFSKYMLEGKNYISKNEFIEDGEDFIKNSPLTSIFVVKGDFYLSKVNEKTYYNFLIKSIKIDNSARPDLKLYLDLYYDWQSLDESNKRNEFVLNSFIEQYDYSEKKRKLFPLKVEFITNRFDFKNPTHIDIIRHRKANMKPSKEDGMVKAKWEAQYIKGAQLFMPSLESLPKDIQFEIKNAGRDLREYMSRVVGEAEEHICLTRPNNTLNKDGKVYLPVENQRKENGNSIDNLVKKEAYENPFN